MGQERSAEEAVLGCTLLDAAFVLPLAARVGVTEEWFSSARHRQLWVALNAMWQQKKTPDLVQLTYYLRARGELDAVGGAEAIEKLIEGTPTSAEAEGYLELFRNDRMIAQLRPVMLTGAQELEQGPEHVAMRVMENISSVLSAGSAEAIVDREQASARVIAAWEKVREERILKGNLRYFDGLPTPWEVTNRKYSGLKPGLHIIAARPSQGKTAMAINWSAFWAEMGIPHLVVSCDMAVSECHKRYISARARISLSKLEFGASHEEMEAARIAGAEICKQPILTCEEDCIDKLHGIVCMAKASHGIRAVIVDYLQVMRYRGAERVQRFDRVSEATLRLKRMALAEGIPVVVCTQLNRNSVMEDRHPDLQDLGDSGDIERAASTVAMLYWDQRVISYWNGEGPFAELGGELPVHLCYGYEHLAKLLRPCWLILAKNQQGPTGRIPFLFYRHYSIFRPGDWDADEAEFFPAGKKGKPLRCAAPNFASIRDDWRVLPEDAYLASHGCLGVRGFGKGLE